MNARLADLAKAGIVCAATGWAVFALQTQGVSVEIPGAEKSQTAADEQKWQRTAPGKLSPEDLLRSAQRKVYAPLIRPGEWNPHSSVTNAALAQDAYAAEESGETSSDAAAAEPSPAQPLPGAPAASKSSNKKRVEVHAPAKNGTRNGSKAKSKTAKRGTNSTGKQSSAAKYIQFNRSGATRKPAAVLPPPENAKPLPANGAADEQSEILQMAHEQVADASAPIGQLDQIQQYQSSQTMMHLQQLYNEAGREMPTAPRVVPINPANQRGQGPAGRNGDTSIRMSSPNQPPLRKPGLLNRLFGRRSRDAAPPPNQNHFGQPMQGNQPGAGAPQQAGQPNQVFYPGNVGHTTGQIQQPANQYSQQQQQQLQQLQQQQQFQQEQQLRQQQARKQQAQPRRFQEPDDAAGRVRLPNIDGQKEVDDADFFPDDFAEKKKPAARQKPQDGFHLEGDDTPLPIEEKADDAAEADEPHAPAAEHASRQTKKPISPMRLDDDADDADASERDRSAADEIVIRPNGKQAQRVKPADAPTDETKSDSDAPAADDDERKSETPADENPFTGMKLLDEPLTTSTDGSAPKAKDATEPAKVADKHASKTEEQPSVVKADGVAADGKAQQAKDEQKTAPPLINLTDDPVPATAAQQEAAGDERTPRVLPEPHLKSFDDDVDEELQAAAKMRRIYERVERPGLKGFCIVELRDHRDLVDAKPQFETTHDGMTYQFSSAESLERFKRNPEAYVPINRGHDVVLSAHGNEEVKGTLEYAAWFRGRLYLFSTAETKATFVTNPAHYADMIVAHGESSSRSCTLCMTHCAHMTVSVRHGVPDLLV